MKDSEPTRSDGMSPLQLRRAAIALSDGVISEEDFHRLEAELLESAEARATYALLLEQDASLRWELGSTEALKRFQVADLEAALALAGAVAVPEPATPIRHVVSSNRHTVGALAASLILAIGLVVAVSGIGYRSGNLLSFGRQPAETQTRVGGVQPLTHPCMWYVEDRPGSDQSSVSRGETLRLVEGEVQVDYDQGAVVLLAAPAVIEFTGPNSAKLVQGRMRGQVAEGAEGFSVETPRATVVDYGTEFGVSVGETGAADVVVFEGEVGVEPQNASDHLRLKMGDGVHLDEYGKMSRLVFFESGRFPSDKAIPRHRQDSLISDIRDNTDRSDIMKYYEIVVGGLREDAPAFVDREFHEWNGDSERGMPEYLLGADYVRMFNSDKIDQDIEVSVTLSSPAVLFVLFDDRNPSPDWLVEGFEDTGDDVGLDTGPFRNGKAYWSSPEKTTGVGPGESIDSVFSIWRKCVAEAGVLHLGDANTENNQTNMYGIAAVPLE